MTVDRDGQVVFYHGEVGSFLLLSGEPTRQLPLMAREENCSVAVVVFNPDYYLTMTSRLYLTQRLHFRRAEPLGIGQLAL